MIAIFAFVNMERGLEVMIVLGDFGGNFGFVSGVVDDFLDFANPTAFRLVIVGLHSLYYNTLIVAVYSSEWREFEAP